MRALVHFGQLRPLFSSPPSVCARRRLPLSPSFAIVRQMVGRLFFSLFLSFTPRFSLSTMCIKFFPGEKLKKGAEEVVVVFAALLSVVESSVVLKKKEVRGNYHL